MTPPLVSALREVIRVVLRVAPVKAAAAVALLLIVALTEGSTLVLLGPLLEQIVIIEENPLPRTQGWLDAAFAVVGLQPSLRLLLLLLVAIAAVRAGVHYVRVAVIVALREDVVDAYRRRLHRAIAAAEWRYLVTRPSAEFVHALSNEVTRVGKIVWTLTELTAAMAVAAVYLLVALRLSPALAALVLGSGLLLAGVLRGNIDHARVLGARGGDARRRLHQTISEHLASLKTARIYGAVGRQVDDVAELSQAAGAMARVGSAAESRFQQSLELGSTILLAAIVFVSVEIIEINIALLLVLMFVFARLMPRLIQIYGLVRALAAALPTIDELHRRIAECEAAVERPARASRTIALGEAITFENVSFTYLRRGERAAVDRLNLRLAAGRTTAIVGPSGSGKSSVAELLIGLLAPGAGRILIDGVPLDADNVEAWRRQVGYVPQETFLFHDTIRANLAWARAGATESELWHALELAAARDFVADLPHGLETIVGERGVLLSGGERQRLSIARAMLRRPELLLLDEATSSLDVEQEQRIQQAVDALHHRVTMVIITHRLTTIRHADVIHVMDAGRVVQSGTWEALHADAGGRFQGMARRFALSGETA